MERIIYFQDKSLVVSDVAPAEGFFVVSVDGAEPLSRAKIVQFLETYNNVVLLTSNPDAFYSHLKSLFTPVVAAGGVVENSRGEWLFIHRNNRWDLPKGHLEPGEELEVCAAREIEEETGVRAEVVAPICTTQHAYYFPRTERWELKTTYWYFLRTDEASQTTPQTEEGITEVRWCSAEQVEEALHQTFPTIRCVVEKLRQMDK